MQLVASADGLAQRLGQNTEIMSQRNEINIQYAASAKISPRVEPQRPIQARYEKLARVWTGGLQRWAADGRMSLREMCMRYRVRIDDIAPQHETIPHHAVDEVLWRLAAAIERGDDEPTDTF